jgi:hypothetical protein
MERADGGDLSHIIKKAISDNKVIEETLVKIYTDNYRYGTSFSSYVRL